MLTMTRAAVEVVNTITTAPGMPDGAGLRIASSGDSPEANTLELELVTGPGESDQVVPVPGARVFLEPGAATYLSDKVLDGQLDEQGQARFVVGPQVQGGAPQA